MSDGNMDSDFQEGKSSTNSSQAVSGDQDPPRGCGPEIALPIEETIADHRIGKSRRAIQPAPAPRFSRTPATIARGAPKRGQGGAAALTDWGFDPGTIAAFRAAGALLLDE